MPDPQSPPAGAPDPALAAALAGLPLATPLRTYPVAVSAGVLALAWARQEAAPEGALVVVGSELAARDWQGQPWSAAPGSLAAAVVLRPGLPPAGEGLLWLLAGLAAAEGLRDAAGVDATVGWPADVLLDDRQVGVVTVDATLEPGRITAAVITLRVAITGPAPGGARTTLAAEGVPSSAPEVLAAALRRLERHYAASVPDLLGAYEGASATLGRRVRVRLRPRGERVGDAVGIDSDGRLRLDAGGGTVLLGADAVESVRPA